MSNVFNTLNKIDVGQKIEKKGQLNYLSWAWAWQILKSNFPNSNYKVYENELGWNYHTDGITCWVKVGVVVNDLEHIEYLPVLDFKNKSIPKDSVTSFNVNTSIQRALTKAIGRHGLGLYIYAGEDLPTDENGQVFKDYKTASKQTLEDTKEYFNEFYRICKNLGVETREFLENWAELEYDENGKAVDQMKFKNLLKQYLLDKDQLAEEIEGYKANR